MSIALWGVGILAVVACWAARVAYVAADRPGDDFGAGIVAWLAMGVAGLFVVAWIVLAAIFWLR